MPIDLDLPVSADMPAVTWSPEEEARASRLELIRAAVELHERDPILRLSLERCFEGCIGLKVRPTQARRHLKSALRDRCVLRWQSETVAIVQMIEPGTGLDLLKELAAAYLAEVTGEPVTPRLLVAALGITSRERLRWTKDGRLKPDGSVTIKRGQLISAPVYSMSDVEFLADNPAIIARWRMDDA